MMFTMALLLALLVLVAGLHRRYRRAAIRDQRRVTAALDDNAGTLVDLSGLALVPLLIWFPWPAFLPVGLVLASLAAAWGGLVALYWARRVAPAEALAPLVLPAVPSLLPVAPPTPRPASMGVPDGNDSTLPRSFKWRFTPRDGVPVDMALELSLSQARYEWVRAEARRPVGDWAHYALLDMPELDELALTFYRLHAGRGWSTLEQASNVLNFTQACIEYCSDEATTPAAEWPRYPIETLMDQAGDCEDDVILAAAILKRLGFEVALLYYPGHCALGVAGAAGLPGEYVFDPRTGVRYFYGETTATGWHLGELPVAYRGLAPDGVEVLQRVVNS